MMETKNVAIVLLAAGNARRFGSNKLMTDLDGVPLGVRAARNLADIPAAAHFAVCQPKAAIAPHYADLGYTLVENPNADLGLSASLHLAVAAAARVARPPGTTLGTTPSLRTDGPATRQMGLSPCRA